MFDQIQKTLKQQNILFHLNEGVTIAQVANTHEGYELAKQILYLIVDTRTVLYLSGGSQKALYEKLASEEKFLAGGVGLVDERFGKKFHDNSNEKMIQDTGFLRYLQMRDVRFYPILQNKSRVETAEDYDQKLRTLNSTFQKSVAILGIGPDGHISSLAPNRKDFKNPMFDDSQKHLLVSEFDDPNSKYGERVGMTFLGLSMIDLLLVLVFGENKKEALKLMFEEGHESLRQAQAEAEIPARFLKRTEIAKKTLVITDQEI